MRNLEDYGTKTQSGRLRYEDAIWKWTVQRRNLEDYGTKDRNLEVDGTKTAITQTQNNLASPGI